MSELENRTLEELKDVCSYIKNDCNHLYNFMENIFSPVTGLENKIKSTKKMKNIIGFRIDTNCRIFLPDQGNAELAISGYQAKTLYILYLLCPDGICFYDLENFIREMIQIYKEVCHFKHGDNEPIEKNVRQIIDRKNCLSESMSKIKKALKEVLKDEQLTEQYRIKGGRLKNKKIEMAKYDIMIENEELRKIKESLGQK